MRIIPAIDIIEGQCVRLSQGNYQQKTIYSSDPLEVAKKFEGAGLKYLHLVDLDGARSKGIVNYPILEKICQQTQLKVDFGGGLKSKTDLKIAFECGAAQITAGSIAARQPETVQQWLEQYGWRRIILGADSRQGKVAVNGWEQTTQLKVHDFVQSSVQKGFRYTIPTDISRDGMLTGPAVDLYGQLLRLNKNLKLIASGGISSVADLQTLEKLGCDGAIVGKAFYEGRITLDQLAALC